MSATRASGINAVRYGLRENVMGLTVVLADGRVIKTGGRARKSRRRAVHADPDPHVRRLSTLGIMTEITLRLYGIPEAMSAAVCSFATLEGAVDTVIQVMQSSIPMARIELLDDAQMDAINRYSKLDYPVAPTLFFEFHGAPGRGEGTGRNRPCLRRGKRRRRFPMGNHPGRSHAPVECPPHGLLCGAPGLRPARAALPRTCACRSANWPAAFMKPKPIWRTAA